MERAFSHEFAFDEKALKHSTNFIYAAKVRTSWNV